MPVTDTEAHAAVGPQDVAVGDRIQIYKSRCSRSGCRREEVGLGRVIKRINADYVVIDGDAGVVLKEGYFFEKVK